MYICMFGEIYGLKFFSSPPRFMYNLNDIESKVLQHIIFDSCYIFIIIKKLIKIEDLSITGTQMFNFVRANSAYALSFGWILKHDVSNNLLFKDDLSLSKSSSKPSSLLFQFLYLTWLLHLYDYALSKFYYSENMNYMKIIHTIQFKNMILSSFFSKIMFAKVYFRKLYRN